MGRLGLGDPVGDVLEKLLIVAVLLLILYFPPFVPCWKLVLSQIVCLSDMAFHFFRYFLVFTILREGE